MDVDEFSRFTIYKADYFLFFRKCYQLKSQLTYSMLLFRALLHHPVRGSGTKLAYNCINV